MPASFVQTAILFAYMAIGVLCARTGILKPEHRRGIANLLVKVTLPALVFSSMVRPYQPGALPTILTLIALSFGVYGVSILIAFLAVKAMGGEAGKRGVYRYGIVFSNVGFMGFPVMEALFGGESLFRTSVYNIAFQVLAFSVGMVLLGWDGGKGVKLRLKTIINPNIISALLGLAFFLMGWSLPAPVHSAVARIGDITTPLSMVFIGASLSAASSLKLLRDWRLWATSLYRVIAAPLLVYAALWPAMGASGFPIEVPVMIAAMPAAANTAILAEESGADTETASMLVTLSTLLSLLTIPLAARFLFGK